ncbi:MAG: 16S rRNA (guanine(966)-N(2))-methyltransferase RsmD [Porticoccaceae bacterium]|nr:16S rRNA (guanine(966)-N(2))-methyltransferase RsmD [Porticoccaceae bacterium]
MARKISTLPSETVRIIGGKWRSRQLKFEAADGLRPTGSRIRETLFNWLAPQIEGARCLDLFAGSGALCFEALSRGARYCTALENNRTAISQLTTNKTKLSADGLNIIPIDTRQFLRDMHSGEKYDVVFLDPPFNQGMHKQIAQLLTEGNRLASNALIYCELPLTEAQCMPSSWQLLKDKTAGNVRFCLFTYVEQSDVIK